MTSGFDWEQRYAESQQLFDESPSELLLQERRRLRPGQTALAAGDGEGRNGVWLARQGLQVTSVDISATALQRARALAKHHGVAINTVCVDMLEWPSWPVACFDLVTSIFVHLPPSLRQPYHQHLWQAIKPGGLIMIEGFHIDQAKLDSGGPSDPDLLLSEAGMQQDFKEAEILRLERVPTAVNIDGNYLGQGAALHFVARHPV